MKEFPLHLHFRNVDSTLQCFCFCFQITLFTRKVLCVVIVVQSLSCVQLFVSPWSKCIKPGFPVLHYLPEFSQTYILWVSDVIQLFHPLSPPSPPALNLSQHQGLIQWVSSSHQVAKVLEFQHQIIEKGREFQKKIYFCFIGYAKAFDCVDHNKLWKILRDGNTRPPDLPLEKSVCRSGSNS